MKAQTSLIAAVVLGAAAACLIVMAAAGVAGGRLLEAILLYPARWLPLPALIGAVAGGAIRILRVNR